MIDLTPILSSIQQSASHAGEQLLPPLYQEPRRVAARRPAHEKPGQALDATALVVNDSERLCNNRGHFFAADDAIRRILTEHFRRTLDVELTNRDKDGSNANRSLS